MPLETSSYINGLTKSWPLGGDPTNKGDDHLRLIKHVLQTQFPGVGGLGFAKAITATEDEINYLGGLTSNAQDQFDALDARITTLEGVLIATPGTVMPFYQTAAPLGWTKVVTNDNSMMRIVSGATGGTAGGTDSPILMDKVPSHTHIATVANADTSHTHTWSDTSTTESAAHTHTYSGDAASAGDHAHTMFKNKYPGTGGQYVTMNTNTASFLLTDAGTPTSGKTATTGAHTHTVSGTSDASVTTHTHDVSGTTSAMSANHIHSHTATNANNAGASNWAPKYMDFIIASKDA